jgi:hypothetical protein
MPLHQLKRAFVMSTIAFMSIGIVLAPTALAARVHGPVRGARPDELGPAGRARHPPVT